MYFFAPTADGIRKRPPQVGSTNPRSLLQSSKGYSVLILVMVFGISILVGEALFLGRQLQGVKDARRTQFLTMKNSLLDSLGDMLTQELAIKNSRFDINSELYRCLTGLPTPCDERLSYDMVLFLPNPPVNYAGGPWPPIPSGLGKVAGGLLASKMLYNGAGGHCDGQGTNNPTENCPLQAIIQFTPLCGGTMANPDFSVVGMTTKNLCPGPANGFEITVGVGFYYNGNLIYHRNTAQDGDSRSSRTSASILLN